MPLAKLSHYNDPGIANTEARVILPADLKRCHYISQILWSYSDEPKPNAVAGISLEDGFGGVYLSFDVIHAGIDGIALVPPIKFCRNTTLIVRLFAGGQSVYGKLGIIAWQERS